MSIGLILILLTFWVLPVDARGDGLTLLGIVISALCALGLVLANRQSFANWWGLGLLTLGLVGAHLWLWQMWSLWESPVQLLRNLNTVVGLLAIDFLVAFLVDVVLVFLCRSGGPLLLGFVGVLYPLALLGVSLMYPSIEVLLHPENLRGQVLWITPLTALPGICCLGLPIFIFQLIIALVKEFRRV